MRPLILALLLAVLPVSVYPQINQAELLKILLDLPAPAPFERSDFEKDTPPEKEFPPEFYSKSKIPPDDAPIEELLAYWSKQSEEVRFQGYLLKPSETVLERIFEEIKKKPVLLTQFLNIIPPEKEYTDFIKEYYDKQSLKFAENPLDDDSDETDEEETPATVREAIETAQKQFEDLEDFDYEEYTIRYSLTRIKTWLTYNSDHFSDELLKKAERVKDEREYPKNKEELIALAKYDWAKAEPIASRLINDETQPASSTLAKWAFYAHYLKEEDESNARKYRRMLQDVVADRKASNGVRDLALDALVIEADFEGRDDWYLSLLEDETLFDLGNYTGLQTFMDLSPPAKWIPKMTELVNSKLPAVRSAAVRNLINFLGETDAEQDKVILRALLPWLSNPNWAKDNNNKRSELIRYYGTAGMTESIPGLIMIVQNEKPTEEEIRNYSNANYAYNTNIDNLSADAVKVAVSSSGLGESRKAAIETLAVFKDARAVPALLAVLPDANGSYETKTVVSAILASGGYNANQQLAYIEAFARKLASEEKSADFEEDYYYYMDDDSLSPNEMIGGILANAEEPDENLVRFMLERIKTLKKTEPQIAAILDKFLQKWKSKVLFVERLNLISRNNADAETILRTLIERETLVKDHGNQVYAMRGGGGIAGGIAACLLEDKNEVASAVGSNDINQKIAALACARLLRIELPVSAVSPYLYDTNPLLSLAAERYLISQDSTEARRLVLAKYPGEAKILGARAAFFPDDKVSQTNLPITELFSSVNPEHYFSPNETSDLDKIQSKLQAEAKTTEDLQGIYAFLKDDTSGHQILRIYKDKAVFSWYEDEARYRERIVKPEELKLIFDYVTKHQVESQPPVLGSCHHGCINQEFVMFGKNGGRRIFIQTPYFYEQPIKGLELIFKSLEQGESELRYWLQDKIEGLEVFLAEKNFKAKSLWKNGDDFRVLVLDEKQQKDFEKEIQKQREAARKSLNIDDFDDYSAYYERFSEISAEIDRRQMQQKYNAYQWRNIKDRKLAGKTSQPAEDFSIVENGQFPDIDYLTAPDSVWKARTSDFEVRSGNYEKDGIYKVSRNGLVTQINDDSSYLNNPVVSPDGKWALISKREENYYINAVYRLNLQTGKESKIKLPKTLYASPIAYIKAHNKFLVFMGGAEEFEEFPEYILEELKGEFTKDDLKNMKPAYYLVDANTGTLKEVKGEFTPFRQITFRNLQKTSNANEFWAAIYDEMNKATKIGRYDTKNFTFKEEMTIPEIALDSMNIWVDERDAKIYFIYEGHLLSLPLKKP